MRFKFIRLVMIPFAFAFISGCATMQDRWSLVVNQNTRNNYENFIKEYPDSEMAKEAKKRIEDPDYAFMTTCQIGTKEAFDGFVNSYPSSEYAPTAKSYIEYLRETKSGDLKSYKRFITQYPNHPFVMEAKTAMPVLWLKEKGNKIGMVVNIGELIDKGLFGGGRGKVDNVRQKVWQRFKKDLEQEGIQTVLLDSLDSGKIREEGIKEVVILDYSESYTQPTPSYYTPPPSGDSYKDSMRAAGSALGQTVGQGLASIFYSPPVEIISIAVKRIEDGIDYYSGFPALSSSVGKINRDEALTAICNNPSPILAITSLKGKDLTDSAEREKVERLLAKVKSK